MISFGKFLFVFVVLIAVLSAVGIFGWSGNVQDGKLYSCYPESATRRWHFGDKTEIARFNNFRLNAYPIYFYKDCTELMRYDPTEFEVVEGYPVMRDQTR